MALTRRQFLLSSTALSAGCAGCKIALGASRGPGATIREPAVGQSWRYAKRDRIKGTVVDTEVQRVSAVGRTIELESRSELANGTPRAYPSWGSTWLQRYGFLDSPVGPLASEVQEPWGWVLVDPHWTEMQVYERPIPLWPTALRPGWSTIANTLYKTPESPDPMPWQLTMHAHNWESITVPAGQFTAFRYTNIIDFRFSNVSERTAAQRLETIWLVPEIGRWVVRESYGTFRENLGTDVVEGNYRWELLTWI